MRVSYVSCFEPTELDAFARSFASKRTALLIVNEIAPATTIRDGKILDRARSGQADIGGSLEESRP